MDGIFLAYGPGVQPGLEVKDAQIIDLAPTILHAMGEAVPEHMDGRVLEEILSDAPHPDQAPTQPDHWAHSSGDNGQGLTEEETQIISERLRSLGYMG